MIDICQELCSPLQTLPYLTQQPYEISIIILPILKVRVLRRRETENLARGYPGLDPHLWNYKVHVLGHEGAVLQYPANVLFPYFFLV